MILYCKESGRRFVTKTRMEEKRKEKRENYCVSMIPLLCFILY